jgi:hypothetical protein
VKFNIGDHLQEIGTQNNGIVISSNLLPQSFLFWYLIENKELGLINHWVPENKLELHKQTLRDSKLLSLL